MLAVMTVVTAGTAGAQTPAEDPNLGGLTLTAGVHVPSVYLFRGIRQEADPALTVWPFFDVGAALFEGDGGLKSVGVNVGVWNSLHTGSSGGDAAIDDIHYEEDFYASVSFGFTGVTFTPTFTAYTSPNRFFSTVKEFSFKFAGSGWGAPYGLLAFEVDNQADGGSNEGTYLELGIGPSWPGGGDATIAIPVKLGLSLNDYYEHPLGTGDSKFGFFDIGALYTVPFAGSKRFGSWSFHVGVDLFALGDTLEFLNNGDKSQVVGQAGLTLSY
jgi:hypothetical protein